MENWTCSSDCSADWTIDLWEFGVFLLTSAGIEWSISLAKTGLAKFEHICNSCVITILRRSLDLHCFAVHDNARPFMNAAIGIEHWWKWFLLTFSWGWAKVHLTFDWQPQELGTQELGVIMIKNHWELANWTPNQRNLYIFLQRKLAFTLVIQFYFRCCFTIRFWESTARSIWAVPRKLDQFIALPEGERKLMR